MQLPLKTLIVENENAAISRIKTLLSPASEVIEIAKISRSFNDAVEELKATEYQLSILDIDLGNNRDCHDLIKAVDHKKLGIITLNSNPENFDLENKLSLQYLHLRKPYSTPGVVEFLSSLFKRVHNPKKYKVFLKIRDENVSPEEREILYIEADGSYCKYHLTSYEMPITVTKSLHEQEDNLNPQVFARCHASFIINTTYVRGWKSHNDKGDGFIFLKYRENKIEIKFSRTYKSDLENRGLLK